MTIQYITNIHDTGKAETVLLLIDSSIQAYNAFDDSKPTKCQKQNITPPTGYEFVDYWTGIDAIFNHNKTVECYGVVFRTEVEPYTYIFAFRGTSSFWDMIDDLGVKSKSFTPDVSSSVTVPSEVTVESGFYDIYSESDKGICICEKLEVPANHDAVTSKKPDQTFRNQIKHFMDKCELLKN